jgi:isoamylase
MPDNKRRDELLKYFQEDFRILRGKPMPLGVTSLKEGLNFAIFSSNATLAHLVIFLPGEDQPVIEFPMDSRYHRTGNVWHIMLSGIDREIEYGFRLKNERNINSRILRFDWGRVLLDPYAKAIVGGEVWGTRDLHLNPDSEKTPRRSKIIKDEFDWEFETASPKHLSDSIIYEMHVRSFTVHPSSGVKDPGTFTGLIDKIPYLKDLGITAVELMPITEFDEGECQQLDPVSGKSLLNIWGYSPIGFFAPNASYSTGKEPGCQVDECKKMIKAFHEAGIEVILDVVFNHTAEGNENGPTLSFRGIDNQTYYMIDPATGDYHNYSGCGNTLNCNHPVVRDLVLNCLRYWVMEMHVDGFRFDLASILGRGRDGEVLHNPPLLEHIAADPVLANTKLIAEAWDAAGLYQVGNFPNWGRWAEWNGKFRDDIRKFVKGDPGMVPALATRLAGSADLYQAGGRQPCHSINFITSHDGFTLEDLVSYNDKHNERNGEDNRDGMNDNYSWNCGFEGITDSQEIKNLRIRQKKNLAVLLLLSRGVPMIQAGDEMGRAQMGNNNAYCQDNELSWLDWTLLEKNAGFHRFFKELIRLRKRHAILRYRSFIPMQRNWGGMITWHGIKAYEPDWSKESRSLAMMIHGGDIDSDFFIIINASPDTMEFQIPEIIINSPWFRVVDTNLPSPDDICSLGKDVFLTPQYRYNVAGRSVVVLRTMRA